METCQQYEQQDIDLGVWVRQMLAAMANSGNIRNAIELATQRCLTYEAGYLHQKVGYVAPLQASICWVEGDIPNSTSYSFRGSLPLV